MRFSKFAFIIAVALISGCATLSPKQKAYITSSPIGARISVHDESTNEDKFLGRTPDYMWLEKGIRPGWLLAELDGYESEKWQVPENGPIGHNFVLQEKKTPYGLIPLKYKASTASTDSTYTYYSAIYKLSLSKVERPKKATSRYGQQKINIISDSSNKYRYIFEDNLVKIFWAVSSRTIAFSIHNKTSHSIKIPWDEAAFIDEKGSSHRVMHSGVKYTDRAITQASSIIARKASIEDIVFPTDYVNWEEGSSYSAGRWKEKPFFMDIDFHGKISTGNYLTFSSFEQDAKSNIGKTIQVLLPLQIEDVINDYIFTFTVDDVLCSQK